MPELVRDGDTRVLGGDPAFVGASDRDDHPVHELEAALLAHPRLRRCCCNDRSNTPIPFRAAVSGGRVADVVQADLEITEDRAENA
jgi:hypothetical protein